MALSKDKAAVLVKGSLPKPEGAVTPDDAIKDPHGLEFLDLKADYSEFDLDAVFIHPLGDLLLATRARTLAALSAVFDP